MTGGTRPDAANPGGDAGASSAGPAKVATQDLGALPVALTVAGPQADAIRTWVEGVLGWQPVDGSADGLVPAVVELCDLEAMAAGRREIGTAGMARTAVDVPRILLVDDDAPAEHAAEVASTCRPQAALGWPSNRDRLPGAAVRVIERRRERATPRRSLRVGGSAGGVGTTTVALSLAGLAAWAGARTFVALRGTALPLRGLPAAAFSTPDLWSRADPVVGVPYLRGAVVSDGGDVPELGDAGVQASVVDAGVDPDVDVLVCRPDAAARAMLAVTTAAAVVLVGDGPAPPRDLRRVAAGRPGVRLPWSVRVARAGYLGRVPAGLPGAWVARLEPLAPRPRHGGAAAV